MIKTENPEISVIIPVYNGASFLPEAIKSIRAQGHPSLEILVVDDGSESDIASLVLDGEEDIRLLRQDHGGVSAARNRGIREARGSLTGFLDADDLWPAGRLAALLQPFLADPATAVSVGRLQISEKNGDGPWKTRGKPLLSASLGAALFRREVFCVTGLLDEGLSRGEDVDFFLRIVQGGHSIALVETVVLIYRIHGDNTTGTIASWEKGLMAALRKSVARIREREADADDEKPSRQ